MPFKSSFLTAFSLGVFLLIAPLPATFGAPEELSGEGYTIAKVNVEYVDAKGYTTSEIGNQVDKARYQRELERKGNYSAIRYYILWCAPSTPTPDLIVKLEARGLNAVNGRESIETLTKTYPHKSHFSGWAVMDIQGETLKNFGRPMAWKVTILRNGHSLVERKSFTWGGGEGASEEPTVQPTAAQEPTATESPQ